MRNNLNRFVAVFLGTVLITQLAGATATSEGRLVAPAAKGASDCDEPCENPNGDTDGDGLSDCVEICLETDFDDPDTDRDGMPDGWELANGLNPLVDDSLGDRDGDALLNIDEYLGGSSAQDGEDPVRVRFVSKDGADFIGGGTRNAPWRTIGFALSRVSALSIGRVQVMYGTYVEDLTLPANVILSGPDPRTIVKAPRPNIIRGTIVGGAGAVLQNLTLEAPNSISVILQMNDIGMKVINCDFVGDGEGGATGLLTAGRGPGNGLVENCNFVSLAYGIDVGDFHPTVRLSTFQNSSGAHILFRADGETGGGSLGKDGIANTGWNRFFRNSGRPMIINERAQSVQIERNDWDTDDATAIDAAIDGPMDFQPFLAAGSALLNGSLFCAVFSAVDQTPVDNAEVSLQPLLANPTTENTNGIYPFPALPADMSYTVRVEAAGFQPLAMAVMLNAGELKTVNFPLGRDAAIPPPGGCQCNDPGKAVPVEAHMGNILIGAGMVLVLVASRRRKP